jgi:Protein of unknown function (DUF3147)
MSTAPEEAPITRRIAERPSLRLDKVREVKARDLGVRFVAGAVTSVVAGAMTLAFGARTGGILLAFPAILAASLTLIEQQDDSAQAREDARGAVLGGCGLGVFATIAALAFGEVGGAIALALATAGWFLAALLGYLLAWAR